MRNIAISVVAAFLLGGCAIGPDYVKPKLDVPTDFADKKDEQKLSSQWWKLFGDEKLNSHVEEALRANKDLKIANLQVGQMLAQFDQIDSSLYPQINANGSLTRQKMSETTFQGSYGDITSTYAAGLSLVSYELDLWGKVRRASEAARATLMSTQYAKDSIQLSIVSSVVDSYFKLVLANEQMEIAKENAEMASQLADIAQKKFDVGYASLIDLSSAQGSEQAAKSVYYGAQSEAVKAQNRLNLLLGKNPSTVAVAKDTTKLAATPTLPPSLSSSLLAKRPDIAQAEQALVSANAQVGIAKAAYFPSISLTGTFGQQSAEFNSLFSGPSRAWSFVPSVTMPLFTAGKTGAGVRVAESASEQALVAYEKAVQDAFSEVDTALNGYTNALKQEKSAKIQEEAARKIYELSLAKYEVGHIASPALFLAKQSWLTAKQSFASSSVNAKSQAVVLIKALGGGWEAK